MFTRSRKAADVRDSFLYFRDMEKRIRITEIIEETADTKTFVFETADSEAFPYQAGQFITLVFPRLLGEDARRNYSLSSAPGIDDKLSFTVKRIPNGEYSRRMIDHLKVGDELQTIGASGYFTLPEKLPGQVVFLAAGSGITPVLPLIKILLVKSDCQVVLIYSNPSKTRTIFYDALTRLANEFPTRLTIEFLFSNAQHLNKARLTKGSLDLLLKKYVTKKTETLFYLCGPFEYMRMATVVLLTEGVPTENIRKENFVVLKPVMRDEPADKHEHTVVVNINKTRYVFITQFPVSILQQAKIMNVPIPYSCESGQCGTCAATCKAGQVWMSHNEVLTEKDLASGRVLTCTGFAVGGDVSLEIN